MGKYSELLDAVKEEWSEAGKGAGGFFGQDLTSVRDVQMAQIQAEAQARLEQAETDRLTQAYQAGSSYRGIPNTTTGPRIQQHPTPMNQPTLEKARTRAGNSSTGGILLFVSLLGIGAAVASRAK